MTNSCYRPRLPQSIHLCPAVNTIDYSGLDSLEAINQRLKDGGITFHLSEVKDPIMDRLKHSHFLQELNGKVYLTQYETVSSLNPDVASSTLSAPGRTEIRPGEVQGKVGNRKG
jgi:SulP family sulfate permease